MFAAIILPTTENFCSSKDICAHIERYMELWDQGLFSELVENTTMSGQGEEEDLSRAGPQWHVRSMAHAPTTIP